MTKKILIGNVEVGGGSSVKIQSMNNTDTRDAKATLNQIRELADNGCDITRVAIPDMEAAMSLKEITSKSPIPVVADIHFDYRLALAAADNGASKIRINPGNIGGPDKVKLVADKCKERHIPIRVGVNSGSISREILAKYGEVNADAMTESALGAVKLLEDQDFDDMEVLVVDDCGPDKSIDIAESIITYLSPIIHKELTLVTLRLWKLRNTLVGQRIVIVDYLDVFGRKHKQITFLQFW